MIDKHLLDAPEQTPATIESPTRSRAPRPRTVTWIAVLTALTISRFSVAFRLPSLEMFDGDNPDAWIGPWISDTMLGLLVPLMVFLALTKTGARVWGALAAYSVIGAFDYVHGLVTQWIHPLNGSAAVTYGGISFFLAVQLVAIALLFRTDVMRHFLSDDPKFGERSAD